LLKLLADENVARRLVHLIREQGVDIIRLQDLGARGIDDRELVEISNRLGRAVLTRDHDFTLPYLLSLVKNGVVYISFQPSKNEIPKLAARIAAIADSYEPKPALLIVVGREHVEIYE
jgi:predicted nuclease of predicted toxin-antitoxin system